MFAITSFTASLGHDGTKDARGARLGGQPRRRPRAEGERLPLPGVSPRQHTGDPRVRRAVGLAAQAYRDKFGKTTILSSARSVEHNQAVGGATDSRHLFPKHYDAIDPSLQVHSVSEVQQVGVWTGIGHHAAAPQSVDHIDLRPGFSPSSPSVFPDH